MDDLSNSVIFPLGNEEANSNFTGKVWVSQMVGRDTPCPIANVTFEPGCINNWHEHMGGQILLVTGGRGWYQEWGKEAQELKAGDVVNIPSHVKHWHGAAKDSWFVHVAITVQPEKGPAHWMEPVDPDTYAGLK